MLKLRGNGVAIASILLGLCLLASLFPLFDIGFRDLLDTVARTPIWVFAILALINGVTTVLGSIKWKLAVRALSAGADRIPLLPVISATSVGVLVGQVVPTHIATAAARVLVSRRQRISWGSSIGSSAYEQSIEFGIIIVIALTSIAGLVLHWSWPVLLVLGSALGLVLALSARMIIELARRLATLVARVAPPKLGNLSRLLGSALDASRSVNSAVVAELTALTLIRYALMVGGAIIMAKALIPSSDPVQVALIFPIVQLAIALPITPAGLGVAEITWTGLFVSSGIPPKEAATAAAAMRLVNLLGFLIFFALFLAITAQLPRANRKLPSGEPDTSNASPKGE